MIHDDFLEEKYLISVCSNLILGTEVQMLFRLNRSEDLVWFP